MCFESVLLRVGVVLLVTCGVSVAVGCRASARPAAERAPSSGSDRTPRATGGASGVAAAPERPTQESVISRVLQFTGGKLGLVIADKDIHFDDAFAKEQARFLEGDWKVPALRRRSGVTFSNVIQTVEGKRIHIGVVEFPFGECKELDSAFIPLSKIGRDTFNIAALAVFRIFRRENSLIVLFSETPFHPKVRALLDSAARDAPGSRQCTGR